MDTSRAAVTAFLVTAALSFAAFRTIPIARACAMGIEWDTAGTFDLELGSVYETSNTGAPPPDEQATWPTSATLSMSDQRIDFADGTHLEWR